jgi:large subunit ribosomal protein L24
LIIKNKQAEFAVEKQRMLETKCYIKKDDKVKVIAGKDKGKIGKVLKVIRKKNRLLVENINIVKRHSRPSAKNKQGGIVEGEAGIQLSNVMLMCNKCITPTRIKMQHLEDGKKMRVCAKCGEALDT